MDEYLPEDTVNGYCYKNREAYHNDWDAVCYTPEYGYKVDGTPDERCMYTHNRLLAMCDGDHRLCDDIFEELDWQFPETLYEEYMNRYEEED